MLGAPSEEEDVSKAYEEFKEQVNKLSRVSTAATHRQFMDEISGCKYHHFAVMSSYCFVFRMERLQRSGRH